MTYAAYSHVPSDPGAAVLIILNLNKSRNTVHWAYGDGMVIPPFPLLLLLSSSLRILYKYGTWVSAISIFIALRKIILHEALAPSAISFFRVQ